MVIDIIYHNKYILLFIAIYTAIYYLFLRGKRINTNKYHIYELYLLVFGILIGILAINCINILNKQDYVIRNIMSLDDFEGIIETLPMNQVSFDENHIGSLEAYYTSNEPFLLMIHGFKGILFFPPMPKKNNKLGVIPLKQIRVNNPYVKPIAIIKTNVDIMVGKRVKK